MLTPIPPTSDLEQFFRDYPLSGIGNYEQNRHSLANLFNAQYMYIFFCDFFTEHIESHHEIYKRTQIMNYTGQLFIHEFEGLIINFLYGAYPSAARTMRWILEATLASTIATIDSSILDRRYGNAMSVEQFQDWLVNHDSNPYNYKIKRKEICTKLGLGRKINHVEHVYDQLSRFSHLSIRTFSRPYADPNFHTRLSVNQPFFNNVFSLTVKTIDLSLFCFIYVISKTTNMSRHDLKYLMKDVRKFNFAYGRKYDDRKSSGYLLPRNIPLTWSIMKKIIND